MQDVSILLVNDNREKIRIVKEALNLCESTEKAYVKLLHSYKDAIDLLKQRSFTFVIVELQIEKTEMTAIEFVMRLRRDLDNFAHVQDIPVIVMGSAVSRRAVEITRDAGATEFVVYPFSVRYLNNVIKSVLEMPRKFIVSKDYSGPDRRRRKDPPDIPFERRNKEDNDQN